MHVMITYGYGKFITEPAEIEQRKDGSRFFDYWTADMEQSEAIDGDLETINGTLYFVVEEKCVPVISEYRFEVHFTVEEKLEDAHG